MIAPPDTTTDTITDAANRCALRLSADCVGASRPFTVRPIAINAVTRRGPAGAMVRLTVDGCPKCRTAYRDGLRKREGTIR